MLRRTFGRCSNTRLGGAQTYVWEAPKHSFENCSNVRLGKSRLYVWENLKRTFGRFPITASGYLPNLITPYSKRIPEIHSRRREESPATGVLRLLPCDRNNRNNGCRLPCRSNIQGLPIFLLTANPLLRTVMGSIYIRMDQ